MGEVFWKARSEFPEPVWRALLAIGAVSLVAAIWATANGRSDLLPDLLLVPAAAFFLYRVTLSRWGGGILRAAKTGDWSESAVVGFSFRHGPLLLVYGVLAWLAVVYFTLLPQWIFGVPEYAYSMDSAFAVVVLAPVREEVLMAALWGFLYCAAPAGTKGKFLFATLVSAAIFVGLHNQTYAGASPFAFLTLGFMRISFATAAWLPTLRGHPPSILPAWLGHTILNALWYATTCAVGSGVQSPLATRLCG